ncbi:MAG: RIO1 family regulatory kinase/ATPase [Anaerolineae bacterium]
MHTTDYSDDRYSDFEARFDPFNTDRKARRKRNPAANRKARGFQQTVDDTIQTEKLDLSVHTTYRPGRFETGWLLEAVQDFFDQALVVDILSNVKGGKEANVYCCQAHPATGRGLLAAKVYRPRMFRNLRNDAVYREGRDTLTAEQTPVKKTDHRIMRALNKKTDFGQSVAHTSWLMHEFTALKTLWIAGVSVPEPVAVSGNAILMEFIGDASFAAPPLESVELEQGEAEAVFQQVIGDIETMLQLGLIHGDLSAYNLLYWEGRATIIDFPQVVRSTSNRTARQILRRDVQRVCEYFTEQGVRCDADALYETLWKRWAEPRADWVAADLSRWEEDIE